VSDFEYEFQMRDEPQPGTKIETVFLVPAST